MAKFKKLKEKMKSKKSSSCYEDGGTKEINENETKEEDKERNQALAMGLKSLSETLQSDQDQSLPTYSNVAAASPSAQLTNVMASGSNFEDGGLLNDFDQKKASETSRGMRGIKDPYTRREGKEYKYDGVDKKASLAERLAREANEANARMQAEKDEENLSLKERILRKLSGRN